MFFGAFLGDQERVASWRRVVDRHAVWLGLTARIDSHRVGGAWTFAYAWLTLASAKEEDARLTETDEWLVMTTGSGLAAEAGLANTEAAWERMVANPQTNAIGLRVSLTSGVVDVFVPAATPEQFFVSRSRGGFAFSSDQRLLLRLSGLDLDERAVFGLFQYGKVPAPFTISKTVQRVPSGHVLTVQPARGDVSFTACVQIPGEVADHEAGGVSETLVRETLDGVLGAVPGPAAVYFSGGVDSTLLAARLAAIGRKDVPLINFSFGPRDERAKLALEIAAHLEMPCTQVVYDPADLAAVLGRLGRDYTYPFGGRSVIPTNLMVHATTGLLGASATVFEGTGADGLFALGPKRRPWEWVYRVPRSVRRLIGGGYDWARLWQYESADSRFERPASAMRRSVQMRLDDAAVIAQNAMDGIAYATPPDVRADLANAIDTYIGAVGERLSAEDRYCMLDLVAVCAGEFAAKCFDPLRRAGVRTVFPFMEPPMLRAAMSLSWTQKCAGGCDKALLKTMLARSVPREWVYLSKEGFIPPFNEMLVSESMQDFLRDVVLSSDNPLVALCRADVVQHLADRTARGQGISNGAQRFLWSLMFASGWLSQLEL